MVQKLLSRFHSRLARSFRMLEALGLFIVFTAAALELLAVRDSDRDRLFFEQHVQAQALLDEVTFRGFWLKEQMLLAQPLTAKRLKDFSSNHVDLTDYLEELANHSLDTYQMVWTRAGAMTQRIENFRDRVGLPPSEELSRAKISLEGLKSSTQSIRRELRLPDDTLKFPITHLREGEVLSTKAREDALAAAFKTTQELEERRSQRSFAYILLFICGSILVVIGKYGNWIKESQA